MTDTHEMSDAREAPQRSQPSPAFPAIEGLTKARDLVLLLGGTVYLCGYSTWAMFSYANDLGPIRAVDLQYFIAGLPVFGGLVSAWALIGVVGPWISDWVVKRLTSWHVVLMIFGVFVAANLLQWISSPLVKLLLYALFAPAAISVMVGLGSSRRRWWHFLGAITIVTPFWLFSVYVYASVVFGMIPQALGGGAPRCARIELALQGTGVGISNELTSLLSETVIEEKLGTSAYLQRQKDNESRGVVETSGVSVWQVDDRWLVVKRGLDELPGDSVQLPVTQVRGIHWLSRSASMNECQ